MKVIVADDSALLREGIAGLLERQGHEVVGRASDADDLLAQVEMHHADVDVVITDVRMPPTLTDDGLRAALRIRATRLAYLLRTLNSSSAVSGSSSIRPAASSDGTRQSLANSISDMRELRIHASDAARINLSSDFMSE